MQNRRRQAHFFVDSMNGLFQQAKRAARGYRTAKNFITNAYLHLSRLKPPTGSPLECRSARRMSLSRSTLNGTLPKGGLIVALCRFMWSATITVEPASDHPSPRSSRWREGRELPVAVRVAGQKVLGRQPFAERFTISGRVKAKPFGWPAASLDPAADRRRTEQPSQGVTVAFHTKRRGAPLRARIRVRI